MSVVKPVGRRGVLKECEHSDDAAMDWRSRDAQLGEDRVDVLLYGRLGKEQGLLDASMPIWWPGGMLTV
jgi:hypothetical protein